MTDIEILMEVFGYAEEVAVAEYYRNNAFTRQTIKAYRAGYEKGEHDGFQKGNTQDYYIGRED